MQRLAPHRDAASQTLVTPQLALGPRGDGGRGSARAALGTAGSVSRPAGSRQPAGRERFGTATPSPPCRAKAKTRPLGCLGTGTRGGSGGRRDPQTEVRRPPSRPPAPDARGLRARSRARTGRPRPPRSSGSAPRIDRQSHRPHCPAPHGQATRSRPCGVYVFAGRRLSPGKMVAAAAATEARLRRTTATATAPAGRNGGRPRDWDATQAGRPGPGAGLRLPRLLLLLLPPLLLFPWAAEAAAAAAVVSGSVVAEAKECDRPCVNGGRCNPGTGQCVCPAGWVGEQCQHCGGRFR